MGIIIVNNKDKELIQHVLHDYSRYYLLYPGGSGGEFLSYLVSEYSSKFRKINNLVTQKKINKTIISLPIFFQLLSLLNSKNCIIDNTVEELYNVFLFKKVNIKEVIEDAKSFLKSDIKPPLLRCHQSLSLYFTNKNSYTILVDNDLWWEYAKILSFIKTGNSVYTIDSNQDIDQAFSYMLATATAANANKSINLLNNAKDWVIKNNIKNIYLNQLDLIRYVMPVDSTLTFEKIFYSTPAELFKKYGSIGNNFYEYENFRQAAIERGNAIKYSNIFTKGYLENIFDITSDNFHVELISWHERNLALMGEYEFDPTPYIL